MVPLTVLFVAKPVFLPNTPVLVPKFTYPFSRRRRPPVLRPNRPILPASLRRTRTASTASSSRSASDFSPPRPPSRSTKVSPHLSLLLLTMLYWEWRRLFRQKLRSMSSKSTLTYQQWSRRRLVISFVLFFVGWKAVGYTLNDMLLWTVDEETGIGRFLSPKEGKERREASERSLDERFLPAPPPKRFALDD